MQRGTPLIRRMVLLAVFLVAATGTILASDRAEVMLGAKAGMAAAQAVLVGEGIALPGGIPSTSAVGTDGSLVWRVYKDVTDASGYHHVFYTQYLRPTGKLAALVPTSYRSAGIPLPATSMGFHFDKEQNLILTYGHQATVVALGNQLRLNTTQAVAYAALAAVITSGSYEPFDPGALDDATRATWESSPELFVEWVGARDQWRLAWRVPVPGAQDPGNLAVIDADSGDLLWLLEGAALSQCQPDLSSPILNETAYPQYSGSVTRTVAATPGSLGHEAHWPGALDIQAFVPGGAQTCDWSSIRFTLASIPGDTYGSPSSWSPERGAGAALYYSHLAFNLFGSLGWSASPLSPARITVNHQSGSLIGGGEFLYSGDLGWGPANMVLLGAAFNDPSPLCNVPLPAHTCPPPPACIDLVAHEWGHGASKYMVPWSTYQANSVSGQLSEAFADVIAHMVRRSNPTDSAVLTWTLFDQCVPPSTSTNPCRPAFQRPAGSFVSAPPLCYFKGQSVSNNGCGGPTTCPYVLQGGNPSQVMENHLAGHMLSVAFYLLADGGSTHKNPALSNGAPDVYVPSVGLGPARRVFFDLLNNWVTPTTTWEALPTLADLAALASGQPRGAVACAFLAIGLAGSYPCS